jgi:quinol monooxygenase YgiN
MHVAIRRYQLDPGSSVDELVRRVNEGFIPIIKDAPGFLAYYALDSGSDTITSVSVFEDEAGAEESNRRAADWVGENLAAMLPNPPEIIAGEVKTQELNLTKLGVRKVTE